MRLNPIWQMGKSLNAAAINTAAKDVELHPLLALTDRLANPLSFRAQSADHQHQSFDPPQNLPRNSRQEPMPTADPQWGKHPAMHRIRAGHCYQWTSMTASGRP